MFYYMKHPLLNSYYNEREDRPLHNWGFIRQDLVLTY